MTTRTKRPRAFAPTCAKDSAHGERVTGAVVYPHRPDLAAKRFWRCPKCGAFVGVHPGSWRPLGSMADAETRKARMLAHDAFDPLWRDPLRVFPSRGSAYAWLRGALGSLEPVHIGEMDAATARRVVALVRDQTRHA